MRKNILTYVDYGPAQSSRIFTWPRFVFEGEAATPVSDTAFPERGCLPLSVVGGLPAKEKIMRSCGKLVVMRFNETCFKTNNRWEDGREPHELNGVIDPSRRPGESAIEFKDFELSDLSYRLLQVINLDSGKVDFSKPGEREVFLCDDQAEPMTSFVAIAQAKGRKKLLYGPFEIQRADDSRGGWRLSSSSSFDNFVYAVDEEAFKSNFEVNDENGYIFAQFVDVDEFAALRDGKADACYDWLPETDLIEAMGRVAKAKLPNFTKTDVRRLKASLSAATRAEAKVAMSPARRDRMVKLLETSRSWDELSSEERAAAVAKIDPDELAKVMLSEENFDIFYGLVEQNSKVAKEAQRAENEARERIIDAQRKAEAAESAADETVKRAAKRQAEAEEAADAAKSIVEEMRQEALAEVSTQLDEADAELKKASAAIAAKQAEESELDKRIDGLKQSEYAARSAVRKVVNDFRYEDAVSEEILKSVAIQEIVGSLSQGHDSPTPAAGAASAAAARPFEAAPAPVYARCEATSLKLVDDEKELAPKRIVERVWDAVCSQGGRDMHKNEIANLLICLSQSRMTTLAGLPGTGKTSLAGLLAGALGLRQEGSARFCEVSVERGWTSYKDLVGYHSPFTGQVEPGHDGAFAAFSALDAEAREAGEHAPYLMLLDEANLSSIEHYWSPFLLACDKPARASMPLSLGGGCELMVPGHLRFLATVNFDHTTEELSPRFIDRSWVVMLSGADFDIEADDPAPARGEAGDAPAYGMEALRRAFAPEGARPSAQGMAKLREVVTACAENGMAVSPRSQIMMRGYVAAAEAVMSTSSAATAGDPVDFAVSQKVLPAIRGDEEAARPVLEAVKVIGGLPMTAAQATRMLEAGEACGFYQFFA